MNEPPGDNARLREGMDKLGRMADSVLSTSTDPSQRRAFSHRLIRAAQRAAAQGYPIYAYDFCRQAQTLADGDEEIAFAVRECVSGLVPGYHLALINDARRNEAWDRALRRAMRPAMRVLEIGTGTGMLAMMAARAGARVTTCEAHPVVAHLARELIARNGFAERVDVICKNSLRLELGKDLAEPAELVFCDNFSDTMFSFDPLQSLADARRRLLRPAAPTVPAAAAVRVALADWQTYWSMCHAESSCDFDVSPAAIFAPGSLDVKVGDPTLTLLSGAYDGFRIDLMAESPPPSGRVRLLIEATRDGTLNGIVHWNRLELDEETVLEVPPEPGVRYFSNLRFFPIIPPRQLHAGEVVIVYGRYEGTKMSFWDGGTLRGEIRC